MAEPRLGVRDVYLARLDGIIRQVNGEVWNDQAARKHMLAGLVMARNMYAPPQDGSFRHAAGLAAALEGPLAAALEGPLPDPDEEVPHG